MPKHTLFYSNLLHDFIRIYYSAVCILSHIHKYDAVPRRRKSSAIWPINPCAMCTVITVENCLHRVKMCRCWCCEIATRQLYLMIWASATAAARRTSQQKQWEKDAAHWPGWADAMCNVVAQHANNRVPCSNTFYFDGNVLFPSGVHNLTGVFRLLLDLAFLQIIEYM